MGTACAQSQEKAGCKLSEQRGEGEMVREGPRTRSCRI